RAPVHGPNPAAIRSHHPWLTRCPAGLGGYRLQTRAHSRGLHRRRGLLFAVGPIPMAAVVLPIPLDARDNRRPPPQTRRRTGRVPPDPRRRLLLERRAQVQLGLPE